jgi:hypothetical protein
MIRGRVASTRGMARAEDPPARGRVDQAGDSARLTS